jgi:hypothetical protein
MTEPHAVRTTVVVVPREGFGKTPEVVSRIIASTPPEYRLIIVEGGAPERIRRRLRALAARHPHVEVTWSARWLRPRDAVNGTIPLIDTEYAVYIDNDVEVRAGWLEALVRCADEEKAGVVHPVYLRGKASSDTIYVAEHRVERAPFEGRTRLRYLPGDSGKSYATYGRARRPSVHFEWNCVLFRTSLLKKLWPLEDLAICAYLDDSFRIEALGEKILLEPAAAVAYDEDRYRRATGVDRDYLLWRWDMTRVRSSLAMLCARWNLHPEFAERKIEWATQRRAQAGTGTIAARVANKVRTILGWTAPAPKTPAPLPLPAPAAAADRAQAA